MAENTQGSDFWKRMRQGKATASRIFSIVDKDSKGAYKASRKNLMYELLTEIVNDEPTETFTSFDMREGTRKEPIARVRYELEADVSVKQILFQDHPRIPRSGASPDGLVGDDGLIEIKAPRTYTHCEYIASDKIPQNYLTQMYWQMACLPERKWCDFVSFDDRMPVEAQLWIKRVERDDTIIAELEREVEAFVNELEERLKAFKGRFGIG
jgi:predicted phage-related endonuclease